MEEEIELCAAVDIPLGSHTQADRTRFLTAFSINCQFK